MESCLYTGNEDLLALPPLSPEFTEGEAIHRIYDSSIEYALKKAKDSQPTSSNGAKPALDIAVSLGHLSNLSGSRSRAKMFAVTQRIVAAIYQKACQWMAKNMTGIEPVDVRVILLNSLEDHKNHMKQGKIADFATGPVIDAISLGGSGRNWKRIFIPSGKSGDILEEEIRSCMPSYQLAETVFERLSSASADSPTAHEAVGATSSERVSNRHYNVAVGGTFDHLHIGHKLLLTMTAFAADVCDEKGEWKPRNLTVGITGDVMLKNKKYAEFLESWEHRQRAVKRFLSIILDFAGEMRQESENQPGANGRVERLLLDKLSIDCVDLSDAYGPTITKEEISAIVISAETRSGGKAVNDKRREKDWHELEVLEVDVLLPDSGETSQATGEDAGNFEAKVSSTEIRRLLSEQKSSK